MVLYIGILHAKREVTNPMMITMMAWMHSQLVKAAGGGLEVMEAFNRLLNTMAVLIAHGYDATLQKAMEEILGMAPALLKRIWQEEVQEIIEGLKDQRPEY